jgi:hypothetical protein
VVRVLGAVLLVLLGALLVEMLFEAWVQTLLATPVPDARGNLMPDAPQWPKAVKNGLYLAVLATTIGRVAAQRRWREFTTAADLALAALGLVFVLAGLFGDGTPVLIAQAGYVYLRGAIVFYAWRALDPDRRQVRRVLTVVGSVVALNALLAIWQTVGGYNTYRQLGWINLTWARINRAHALLDHPNHLGHLLAITMLGLLSWFVARRRVGWAWWAGFFLLALGMSATQSRESTIGFVLGAVVIAVLRRGGYVKLAVAVLLVIGLAGAQLAVSPANRAELARRMAGVFSALHLPSGAEGDEFCVSGNTGCSADDPNQIPQREVRVLYAQQGIELWTQRPFLGYGVGQFGGIVAYEHDPRWYQDPRFGPEGFRLYGSNEKQVDSFWLHLLVETGSIGFLTYLAWLALLILPVLTAVIRRRRAGPAPPQGSVHPFGYWAPAALVFAVAVAFLAPSLEDPLFPAQLFTVLGLAWVLLRRRELTSEPPLEQRTAS